MIQGTDVVGVFDWEMATLGDPLADLGYALLWWGTSRTPLFNPSQAVADLPGFPTAEEVCARYGADPDAVRFHVRLAAFKLTIIGEGNRARARRLSGAQLASPSDETVNLGEHADLALAQWALED